MGTIAWIAAGGALGAVARYGLSTWVHTWAGFVLPWGTLAVNLLGSFLLGGAVRWLEYSAWSPELRIGVTVGLLGAFTTFSTYSHETVAMLQRGEWGRAVVYALGSVVLGLMCVAAGVAAAHLALGRESLR